MATLLKLKQISDSIKEYRGLESLTVGEKYKVLSVKTVNTRFGDRTCVELEDSVVFLGQRYNILTNEDFKSLNKQAEQNKLFIKSKGKIGKSTVVCFGNEDDEKENTSNTINFIK